MTRRLLPLALAAVLALGAAAPALATGGVYCDGARDPAVGAYLTVGRVPGFVVVGARIETPGQAFDLNGLDGGSPVMLVQRAIVGDLIVADFADPSAGRIVASLRVMRADDGEAAAAAGTLSVPGIGVWAVICEID